jgi:hypothetical protein
LRPDFDVGDYLLIWGLTMASPFSFLTRTEGAPAKGADWRDAVKSAENTAPPEGLVAKVAANVKRMPLDNAVKGVTRANAAVVQCDGDHIRAVLAMEQLCKEHREAEERQNAYVEKCAERLQTAKDNHAKAQIRFFEEAAQQGVMEGINDLVGFIQRMESRDDETVITEKL